MSPAGNSTVKHEFETLCLQARNLMNASSKLLFDAIDDDRDNELWMVITIFDKAQEEFELLVRAHWRDYQEVHSEIRRLRTALEEKAAA